MRVTQGTNMMTKINVTPPNVHLRIQQLEKVNESPSKSRACLTPGPGKCHLVTTHSSRLPNPDKIEDRDSRKLKPVTETWRHTINHVEQRLGRRGSRSPQSAPRSFCRTALRPTRTRRAWCGGLLASVGDQLLLQDLRQILLTPQQPRGCCKVARTLITSLIVAHRLSTITIEKATRRTRKVPPVITRIAGRLPSALLRKLGSAATKPLPGKDNPAAHPPSEAPQAPLLWHRHRPPSIDAGQGACPQFAEAQVRG